MYKVEAMSFSMRPTLRRAGIVGLLAVALVMLLAEGSQLRHVHESDTLGLYNEQHVFQGLAALTNGAPLPDAPGAAYLLLVVATAAIVEGLRLAVPAARHAAPRAPPSR